jgi:hypothetical protein
VRLFDSGDRRGLQAAYCLTVKREFKELSPLQERVYELHSPEDGVSFGEIAEEMGISRARAHRLYHAACKKLGHDPKKGSVEVSAHGLPNLGTPKVEIESPEKVAAAIVELCLPKKVRKNIRTIAEECGLTKNAVKELSLRMNGPLWPVKEEIGEVCLKEFSDLCMTNAWNIAASIDREVIEAASLKDRTIALGILTDKSLLVQGKPTEINVHEARGKLEEVLGAVAEALQRRGMDLPPATLTVPAEAIS